MISTENNVQKKVPEDQCTGCSACLNVCPTGAISMVGNSIGHILPRVDVGRCIDCGKCVRTCPALNKVRMNTPGKVYAGWTVNIEEHLQSTSGGIAASIARMVLERDGVVYASAFVRKPDIRHIRVTKSDDLRTVRGSKYAQSNIYDILKSVKKDLSCGKEVVFIGTPCQVAGLKNYLSKDYEKLLCIGLVCHGVPPQNLLFEHLKSHDIDLSQIDNITFRQQKGEPYVLTVYSGEKVLYRRNIFQDLYYSGFNDCLTLRESCIKCRYTSPDRVEDITLGDFHGLGKKIPFRNTSGGNISLILANNAKGQSVIENALTEGRIAVEERTLDEALMCNPQLRKPAERRANYGLFVRLYPKLGFEWAGRIVMWRRLIKNRILQIKNRKR